MDFLTRNKLVVGVAILLIALNIALIGTVGFHLLRGEKQTSTNQTDPQKAQEFVSKQLGLNADQQCQFKELRSEHMQGMRVIRVEIRDTYQRISEELGTEEPNLKVLDSLSQRIGTLHANQQNLTNEHFLKLRKVCRPEQHKHLKKMLNRMMNNNPMMKDRKQDRPKRQRNRGNTDK